MITINGHEFKDEMAIINFMWFVVGAIGRTKQNNSKNWHTFPWTSRLIFPSTVLVLTTLAYRWKSYYLKFWPIHRHIRNHNLPNSLTIQQLQIKLLLFPQHYLPIITATTSQSVIFSVIATVSATTSSKMMSIHH